MVSLTFYGGVGEIGGNKILLEDRDTKVFLDFGMSFGKRSDYFEEYLSPRSANGIGDFLEFGLIPDLEGIYRSDLMAHHGRKIGKPEVDAVLLSHAHADHANYISFLHEDIPVHLGKTAMDILEAIHETIPRDIESEVIEFRKRPCKNYKDKPVKRTFKTFRTGDRFRIGSLEVEPVHVDHSVPGAYGFIIHTTEGAVVYTGDLRLHGAHPEMTRDFVKKAAASSPVAMISEGTRINEQKGFDSEQTVYAGSKGAINMTKKFAVAEFNFKDVDRIRTFYTIAKDTGRKLVVSMKNACFLERYAKDPVLKVPGLDDPHVCLFKKKKRTGTYCDKDYDEYERQYLKAKNIVTAADLKKDQGKYLFCLNFWNMQDLVDIKPEAGSTFIHSLSEPFNEEMEVSDKRMHNWLRHFNMRKVQCHCSGHALGSDLKSIITQANPKKLFPVHTEFPQMFKGLVKNTVQVKLGERYNI